jgi:hypothetical protein
VLNSNRRYFSGYQLIQTAFDLKEEYTGDPITFAKNAKRTEFWEVPKVLFPASFSEVNEKSHETHTVGHEGSCA